MIKLLPALIVAVAFASCAAQNPRRPSGKGDLGEIVTQAQAGDLCEGRGEGGACLAPFAKAEQYCREHGGRLPTAMEYVAYLEWFGIRVMSVEEFRNSGLPELKPADIAGLPRKDGFYRVACAPLPDGTDPTFYMNDFHYRRPPGLPGNHLVWTATSPPGYPQAAHVVYDQWGGGGGKPAEHMKTFPNAFRCLTP